MRFSAVVTQFNSLSKTTKLSQLITALMLLSNAGIENSQRLSVHAADEPSSESFPGHSTNDNYLSAVTYKKLSAVVKNGSEYLALLQPHLRHFLLMQMDNGKVLIVEETMVHIDHQSVR